MSEEIRTVSRTGGEKGTKLERFDLIPVEALSKVAQLYGKGAEKYAEHNWRKGYDWSKSYAALQRHAHLFWSGEDIDPEMQLPHMAAVVFHALTLMTFMDEQPLFDDRWISEDKDASEEALAKLREKLTGGVDAVSRYPDLSEEELERLNNESQAIMIEATGNNH